MTHTNSRLEQQELYFNSGNSLYAGQHYKPALEQYKQCIQLEPKHVAALNNQGTILKKLERYEDAYQSYQQAIKVNPVFVEAHYNQGNLLIELKRYHEAVMSLSKAAELKPGDAEIHNGLARALSLSGRYQEAIDSFQNSLKLNPDNAETLCNYAILLNKLNKHAQALISVTKAIALQPRNADAHFNQGNIFLAMGAWQEALHSYRTAMDLSQGFSYLFATIVHLKQILCDWRSLNQDFQSLLVNDDKIKNFVSPFYILGMPASSGQQLICAKHYASKQYSNNQPAAFKIKKHSPGKIRIGYFSADFYNHAVSLLMVELFEKHDRKNFEIIGLPLSSTVQDDMRSRLKSIFDQWHDLSMLTDQQAIDTIVDLEIDIAVDLNGYTDKSRTAIFVQRIAPIQVNYIGYPGTMGAEFMDYIIADPIVIPEKHKCHYSEKIVFLPDCYQVNDAQKYISDQHFTREKLGLPADGFVFCCFNNSFKIVPDIFDIWMRLLLEVKGSVLWLIDISEVAKTNLRAEAIKRGVEENQLIFTPKVKLAEHLARQKAADLFLDTPYYNAHATASDALWAGLPLITLAGETFASRVAASILSSIGLTDMITESMQEYEQLALSLAQNPEKLNAVRLRLKANKDTYPLFDTPRYIKHLESAYQQMLERATHGQPPEHIYISADKSLPEV